MSDEEDMRRHEEEWNRFQRISSLDTEGQQTLTSFPSFVDTDRQQTGRQQTLTGRRRHPAGATSPHISGTYDPSLSQFSPPSASSEPFGVTNPFRSTQDLFTPQTNDPWEPRPRSRHVSQPDLSQQFQESLNLGETQPYSRYAGQQPPAAPPSERLMGGPSRIPYAGKFSRQPAGQPAPSALSQHIRGAQAAEQSVRPRPQPSSVPSYARQSPIPDTPLVDKYRDPVTGRPSWDRLRGHSGLSDARPPAGGPGSSREMGAYLSNLSRDQISLGILAPDEGRRSRKQSLLTSRGFERVEGKQLITGQRTSDRYVPPSRSPGTLPRRRNQLLPRTGRDSANLYDPRFSRPIREMEKKRFDPREARLAPAGRQQWGPQPLRRAYSLPDLSDPNLVEDMDEPSRMDHFEERYGRLPTTDRERYKQFHDQVSWASQPQARARMVKPPSIGNIRDIDHRRLAEMRQFRTTMMNYRIGQVSADKLRKARRDHVRKRSYQQTSIPPQTRGAETKPLSEAMSRLVRQRIPEAIEDAEED